SSSKLSRDQTSNPTSSTNPTPKGRIRRSSKQKVENSNFEEHLPPVATMTNNRTMAEMLRAPTEGCAEAIVVPSIPAEQFKLKYRAACRWLEKEPPRSITTWDDLVSKFINEFFPHSLNAAAGGNLLEKSPQDALTIIENKSKTSVVTIVMTAMLKQLQANPPLAQVKAVEEICVTCGGAHSYYQCLTAGGNTFPEFKDNIQGYVSAAASNYNQGNPGYRPQGVANQMRPPEKIKRMNDVSMKAMQNQIDMVKSKLKNEMKTSIQTSLSNQTNEIKNMMASLLQMNTASTSGSGSLPGNTVANPKGELKAITTRNGLVTDGPTVPTPPKSVTPEEDESVILKKLPEKLGDPGKFLITCGFRELKCKALADLGASINLMPLSVWKKLGLPDLIPTRMTLELANRAICTPDGIVRDVFVPVGKFTFPAHFVIVDYESDPRVPLILGRPFLRTARALIDVHGEEMILRDGDERLTLNMKHDIAIYSNHPHRESVNLINIFNVSSEDCLEVSNQQSGNPTFSLHKDITSPEVTHDIHDLEGCEDSDLKDSIDQIDLANFDAYFFDPTPEMFNDKHAPDYSFPSRFNVYPDDFLEIKSDADNFYDDPFDSKGEKIKESELLIDELDLPCDILPYSEYDSFASQDFSRNDDFPSPDNEDKVFNPGILIHEKSVIIITRVAQEKKLAISYASLVFEYFDPPFYELLVFKDVPKSMTLLLYSFENKEKVFKPWIYTSEKVKERQENDKIESKPDKNGKRFRFCKFECLRITFRSGAISFKQPVSGLF
nr:reverse transcriptase domain-containing protein [Tanacetum cinerariifolium]